MKKISVIIVMCGVFFLSVTTVLAELPPQVVFDMNMKHLGSYLKEGNFKEAITIFPITDELLKKGDLKIGHSYYYYRAETMLHEGYFPEAQTSAEKYIDLTGTSGKFYDATLDLLNNIPKKKNELKQKKKIQLEKEIQKCEADLAKFKTKKSRNKKLIKKTCKKPKTTPDGWSDECRSRCFNQVRDRINAGDHSARTAPCYDRCSRVVEKKWSDDDREMDKFYSCRSSVNTVKKENDKISSKISVLENNLTNLKASMKKL